MDHLPYPQDPALPALDIPYLTPLNNKYDGGSFADFPRRMNWVTFEGWHGEDLDITAMRAQQWLYFGLLDNIYPKSSQWPPEQDAFTRLLDGKVVITTKNLRTQLRALAPPCMRRDKKHRPL